MCDGKNCLPTLVRIDLNIITADHVCGKEADNPLGGQKFFLRDPFEQRLRVVVEVLGDLARNGIIEEIREPALHFPGLE